MRQISKDGLKLIKKAEGLRLEAYQDISGIWTIGYGHTSSAGAPEVKAGLVITKKQALGILKEDLKKYEKIVEQYVTVPLNDNQFSALVSFVYNVGKTSFKNSRLLSRLNRGEYSAVPVELSLWVYAGRNKIQGLVNRRSEEAKLWEKEVNRGVISLKSNKLSKLSFLRTTHGKISVVSGFGLLSVSFMEIAEQLRLYIDDFSFLRYLFVTFIFLAIIFKILNRNKA